MKYLRWMKALALSGTAGDMSKGQLVLVNYILALSDKFPLRKYHSINIRLLSEMTGLAKSTLQAARTDAIANGWLLCDIGNTNTSTTYRPACPFTEAEVSILCGGVYRDSEHELGHTIEHRNNHSAGHKQPQDPHNVYRNSEHEQGHTAGQNIGLISPSPSPLKDACMHAKPLQAHSQDIIQWFIDNDLCVFEQDINDLIILYKNTEKNILKQAIAYCKKKRIEAGERTRPCRSDVSTAIAKAQKNLNKKEAEKQKQKAYADKEERDQKGRAEAQAQVAKLKNILSEIHAHHSQDLEQMLSCNVRNWSIDRSKITVFSIPEIQHTLKQWEATQKNEKNATVKYNLTRKYE